MARSTRSPPDEKQPAIAPPDPGHGAVGDLEGSAGGGADVVVRGLTWRPLRRRTPVLDGLDLTIPAGQRVLLAGPSGAGKSSLLRALAGLLLTADHGDLSGSVRVAGRDVEQSPGGVGLLLQDPQAAVVAETVGRDVAFGLENSRVPRDEIWPRVHTALRSTRFPYSATHPTRSLSGGETQRLALAGHLVLDGQVLLLDEPTSMLDPDAAQAVREAVQHQIAARGCTTVVVEHHLEHWVDFADRLVVLGADGAVVADGDPRHLLSVWKDALAHQGVWVPGLHDPAPVAVPPDLVAPWDAPPERLVTATGIRVELPSMSTDRYAAPTVALADVDACLSSGRALAVSGRSGAGKSTLVSVLAGLLRPTAGQVRADAALATSRGSQPWRWRARDLAARLSWAPQTPEHGVVTTRVRDEVLVAARACGRDDATARQRADGLLAALGLEQLADANPYHLSGGEQRRLMVAAALAHGPCGVLLDEPTVGQDRRTWAAVVGALATARDAGTGVAVSTHDMAAVGALADDRLVLDGGRVAR